MGSGPGADGANTCGNRTGSKSRTPMSIENKSRPSTSNIRSKSVTIGNGSVSSESIAQIAHQLKQLITCEDDGALSIQGRMNRRSAAASGSSVRSSSISSSSRRRRTDAVTVMNENSNGNKNDQLLPTKPKVQLQAKLNQSNSNVDGSFHAVPPGNPMATCTCYLSVLSRLV